MSHDNFKQNKDDVVTTTPKAKGKGKRNKQSADQNNYQSNDNGQNYKFSPRNEEQREMFYAMEKNDLVFATGPAGTGKTHVAVAKAVEDFKSGRVKKIILSRPAVEAEGERIGFLPGTKEQKIAPYMQPLYDELDNILGMDARKKMMESGLIEIVPLSFLRGRTLSDAFIILDEAQNATKGQMKMVLSRAGKNSKIAVTGDLNQNDLPENVTSGLEDAVERFSKVSRASVLELKKIVRSELADIVVNAYEGQDSSMKSAPSPRNANANTPKR